MLRTKLRYIRAKGKVKGVNLILRIMATRHFGFLIVTIFCILSLLLSFSQFSKPRLRSSYDANKRTSTSPKFAVEDPKISNVFHGSPRQKQATTAAAVKPETTATGRRRLSSAFQIRNTTAADVYTTAANSTDTRIEEAKKKLKSLFLKSFTNYTLAEDDTEIYFPQTEEGLDKAEMEENGLVDPERRAFVARVSNYAKKYRAKYQHYYNKPIKLLPQQTKGVIIITNYRSGSTFLGQLFNYHTDAFYTFEPLYPFTESCFQTKLMVQHLHRLLKCDMPDMADLYEKVSGRLRKSPVDVECLIDNFCFRGKTNQLCSKELCPFGSRKTCRRCGPLHLPHVMNFCRSKKLSVIKVIRLCNIKRLKPIVEDPTMDLKIIHLVRDPRGILSSRLKIRKNYPTDISSKTNCLRLRVNAEAGLGNTSDTEWLKSRYLRVRYEDLALQPYRYAQQIYDFVGLEFQPQIKSWIKRNTRTDPAKRSVEKKLKSDPYSTTRDSASAMESWRKHLSLQQVMMVQGMCPRVFELFGYTRVFSQKDLVDFSRRLV